MGKIDVATPPMLLRFPKKRKPYIYGDFPPILSILLNNFSMAIEIPIMPVSTQKYGATDISGNYADMAKAFGGYGERVTQADQIIPAIQRGIEQTQAGVPALLEFITAKETEVSKF